MSCDVRVFGFASAILLALSACSGSTVQAESDAGTAGSTATGGSGGDAGTGGSAEGGSGGTGGSGAIAGSGGNGGTGGTLLDSGLNPDTGFPMDAACASTTYEAEPIPRGMLVVVDRSVSMAEQQKWDAVRDGVLAFAALPETDGIGFGLLTFPVTPSATVPTDCEGDADCGLYGPCLPMDACSGSFAPHSSCDPADYAPPQVPMLALPGAYDDVQSTLTGTVPDAEATTTTPALVAAVGHASQFAPSDAIVDLVLLTDGEPTGCMTNTIADAAGVAAAALASSSIRTWVIALGSEAGEVAQIAAAGGTDSAVTIATGASAASEVQGALSEILQDPCAYRLPPDPSEVYYYNLVLEPEGEESETIFYVETATGCDMAPGWYVDDPASPTRIELCPEACEQARQPGAKLWIQIGCPTVVGP